MSNLIDLALGKRATQSSKSRSDFLPLERIASRALSGETGGPCFATGAEWFPWWQVDLEQICHIERVVLFNTHHWPSRSKLFTIMVSDDENDWREVHSKTDHTVFGAGDEDSCQVAFTPALNARYVRIRLDNWDHLHLAKVQVFGSPLTDAPHAITTPRAVGTTVFATNFNEDDAFLPVYVDNFVHYTDDSCHLVLNFPVGRTIPRHLLADHPRVHIFNGTTPRKKWGATLIIGHMESYGHALDVLGSFDYFCTCASNGLFLRAFDARKAVDHLDRGNEAPVGMTREYLLDVHIDRIPRGTAWIWDNLDDSLALRRYLVDEADVPLISLAQIEGLFASSAEWGTLYERMDVLKQCDKCLPSPVLTTPALEEFLPVSFFRRFGQGRYTNICHMLWDPLREVSFSDLIQFVSRLPAHMCQAKWFPRDKDAITTAAISVPWSRSLLTTLAYDTRPATLHDRFVTRALTTNFNRALQQQEVYTPLTRLWREDPSWGRAQWISAREFGPGAAVPEAGKPFFAGQPEGVDGRPAAWLDCTHACRETMVHSVVLTEDADHCVAQLDSCFPHEAGQRHEWGEVWSVLFISPLAGDAAQIFRLSLKHPFTHTQEQLLHNIRRHTGDREFPWVPMFHEDQDGYRHYYYLRPEGHTGEIWIGLPSFHRTATSIEVSFGTGAV